MCLLFGFGAEVEVARRREQAEYVFRFSLGVFLPCDCRELRECDLVS